VDALKKFGNKNICTSAVIIRDYKILLGLRHYTPDKWKYISVWTTPGGRCEEGETIEDNLRRETFEETGIIHLKIIKFLGKVSAVKEGDTLYVFYCTTNQKAKLCEPDKFSKWEWFDIDKIPKDFINPRLLPLINGCANLE